MADSVAASDCWRELVLDKPDWLAVDICPVNDACKDQPASEPLNPPITDRLRVV